MLWDAAPRAMEGTLEKRVRRAFGHAWADRVVRLTSSNLEVEGKEGVKKYSLSETMLIDLAQGPPTKWAFALATPAGLTLVTLATSKFEHARWVDAIKVYKVNLTEKMHHRRRRTAAFGSPAEFSPSPQKGGAARPKFSPMRPLGGLDECDDGDDARSSVVESMLGDDNAFELYDDDAIGLEDVCFDVDAIVGDIVAGEARESESRRDSDESRRDSDGGRRTSGPFADVTQHLLNSRPREAPPRKSLGAPPKTPAAAPKTPAVAPVPSALVAQIQRAMLRAKALREAPLRRRFERYELTFQTGPFGIQLDTAEPGNTKVAIIDVKAYGEHAAALRNGDEICGYKTPGAALCSFFEDEADVEAGGAGVYTVDDAYGFLEEISEGNVFPTKLLLRRPVAADLPAAAPVAAAAPVPAPAATADAAPSEEDEAIAKYELMVKRGVPAEAVLMKAKSAGLDAAAVQRLRDRFYGAPPEEAVSSQALPVATARPELEKFLRMAKCGVPHAAVFQKAAVDLDAGALEALRVALEGPAPAAAPEAVAAPVNDEAIGAYLSLAKRGVPPPAIVIRATQEAKLSEADLQRLKELLGIKSAPAAPSQEYAVDGKSACKGVHWTVKKEAKRTSLWSKNGRKKRESLGARADDIFEDNAEAGQLLEEMFAARPKAAPLAAVSEADEADGEAQPKADKPKRAAKEVELLDHQKALALQIALASLRGVQPFGPSSGAREAPGLVRALLACGADAKLVDADALRSVASALPTFDDATALAAAAASKPAGTKFTRATTFVLAALRFGPHLAAMLETLAACQDGSAEAHAAFAAAKNCAAVAAAIRESRELRAALRAALALGNRLNAGTQRGGAKSVSVMELERLAHTKSRDGASTPFDLLARALHLDGTEREGVGLDGAAIDATLRAVKAHIESAKLDARHERTFDAAAKIQQKRVHLEALAMKVSAVSGDVDLATLDVSDVDPADSDLLDAAALFQFAARARGSLCLPLDAALAPVDVVLCELRLEEAALRDHCGENDDVPFYSIFDGIASFCNHLIVAREKLLHRLKREAKARKPSADAPRRPHAEAPHAGALFADEPQPRPPAEAPPVDEPPAEALQPRPPAEAPPS
ncbi:formin homology 2 domain-containing protein [Pelagophyceae sp. CCMP2097]|nr:formin homology 2 domain-containing protein [Pelagophyceae sp. CCMP2097]|mmetsp:Transcript_15227/g.54171  ORF Transcript_15227/g.54171 Transcript_15227/m.54171 type:complete len:1113 (-) Transcript_15227:3-3341(-)